MILPEEVAAVEAAIKQHPASRRYRIAVKHDRIEIYEQITPNFEDLVRELGMAGRLDPDLASQLQSKEERYAHHTPVLRFTLLDPTQRLFGVKRMCYRGSIDGWLDLGQTGPVAELSSVLIPALGTDQFYELW